MNEPTMTLPGALWHVTLTYNGEPTTAAKLQSRLENLEFAHPFGLSARYSPDVVELRYWDEGHDCQTVTDAGLRLWGEFQKSLGLPSWPVVGLEVLDRPTFRRRWPAGSDSADLLVPGVRPL